MKFSTPVQQKCYERVAPMMEELFGPVAQPDQDVPRFWLTVDSAQTRITVLPFDESTSIIEVYSAVVQEVKTTPELMQYLLTKNADMVFGAFGIDDDGDVIFRHTIMGDTCDKEELKVSVLAVASTAEREDDEIVAKFGGKRGSDMMTG